MALYKLTTEQKSFITNKLMPALHCAKRLSNYIYLHTSKTVSTQVSKDHVMEKLNQALACSQYADSYEALINKHTLNQLRSWYIRYGHNYVKYNKNGNV